MKKTIYIYRGSLTGGGCTKIIRDLIILLHAQNKFNIVLISYVCSEFDVATDEDGNSIPVTHITFTENNYWKAKIALELESHVNQRQDSTLISFLDANSQRFISICSSLLRKDMHWINFDTNHPLIIQSWFRTKNQGVGISYSDLCNAVDVVRLENKNFDKYIPKTAKDKIISFYNTVTIPEFKKKKFDAEFNLINVNGLRESRKSILPFIRNMHKIIDKDINFKLHILGEESNAMLTEYDSICEQNPNIKKHIELYGVVDNIHDFYASCDIMITTADYEGTSNAVLESFSHEVPVFCLDYSLGLSETIEHDVNGLLCESAESMVDSVLSVLSSSEKLSKLKSGCKKIKKEILDESSGIGRYIEIINDRKVNHNKDARKKLVDYSKKFLMNPGIYRQSLDALVVYVETETFNLNRIHAMFETDAFAEARFCLFIVKHRGEDDLVKFTKDVIKDEKCVIVFDYEKLPDWIQQHSQTDSSADGLAMLSLNKSLGEWMQKKQINTIAYFDANFDNIWWLKKYQNFLKDLSKYQYMDTWIWMVGSDDIAPNNCVFSFDSWNNFDMPNFIGSCSTSWFVSNNKLNEKVNLPKEIMRKIRRLY